MTEIKLTTEAKTLPFSINGEEFTAYQVPGISFMNLIGKLGDENVTEQQQAMLMYDIFKTTMTAEEFARFEAFAANPANGVGAEVLFELISKLVEGSGQRPTGPSPSSASGEESDGAGSTDLSSVKE